MPLGLYLMTTSFNPRSREGSDSRLISFTSSPRVSIHAPAKGATFAPRSCSCLIFVSIHAPAKGATQFHIIVRGCAGVSIHAPAKGATDALTDGIIDVDVSIHAPAKGATLRRGL